MAKLARRRSLVQGAGVAAAIAAIPGFASGQAPAFPGGRPIHVLVGFAPGGGTDVTARILAQQLSGGPLGTIVVDNRSGASGLIAARALADANPDGTTLMVATQTIVAVAPLLYKAPSFDPLREIAGVTMLGASPMVLVVNPSFAAKSLKDLIAMAKAKPGAINYGSGGIGSTPHMATELLLQSTGVRMTHVPYRGEAPAIADVTSGQLPLMFANVSTVTPQVKSGALRALVVTSAQRAPSLPDIPTLAEAGIAGAETATWFCLIAPKATPRDIVQKVNAEVRRALAVPEVHKRFADLGQSVEPSSPEELDATIKSEIARWRGVIQRAGIKATD